MTFKVVSEGGLKLSTMGLFGFQTFLGNYPQSTVVLLRKDWLATFFPYAFDKTIKRDTKCFEKSFLASVHPRLICYQLLLIFSEVNFSGSHFRRYCITHVLFNSFQTNIGFYSQHKKWSFRLRISSIHVTKSSGNCGSGFIFTEENLIPKKILAVARGGGGLSLCGYSKNVSSKDRVQPSFLWLYYQKSCPSWDFH